MKILNKLRAILKSHMLDGFIIPSNDEFQSEYVPDYANRLKFLTGFSGSNGVALVTNKEAVFFTDGRYLLQAQQELGDHFKIQNISTLYDNPYLYGKIGYDPKLHTNVVLYKNCSLMPYENLIDLIWDDKPTQVPSQIFHYPLKYAGETKEAKLHQIQSYLQLNKIDALIITDPTNICWLLNIRAHDVDYNPILLSYAILEQNGNLKLFSNSESTIALTEFSKHLKLLEHKKVQLDPNSASIWIKSHFKNVILEQDPCILAKACKNNIEIKQARRVHIIDGVALSRLLHWLERNHSMNEISVTEKLLEFRSAHPDFIYPSFPTIAGFAEHGAIIHYHATKNSNKTLTANGLFLLDSGGQYFGGTTDITRVIPIGRATYQQKLDFTLVLKGHIALANSQFPVGTRGSSLDVLARQFLWQYGKDYAHGTGHGVGNCLSVHEGPQRISQIHSCPLKAGMIISNEPGYYKNGEYGIRIENLMLVVQLKNGYLGMETLSLAPIDHRLILKKILSETEKKWLNSYHQQIYKKLSPFLNQQEKSWLKSKTIAV